MRTFRQELLELELPKRDDRVPEPGYYLQETERFLTRAQEEISSGGTNAHLYIDIAQQYRSMADQVEWFSCHKCTALEKKWHAEAEKLAE